MGVSVFRVPRRLYWTADKSRLVEHGSTEAAFLAFPVGSELSLEEARRFRVLDMLDTPIKAPVPDPAPEEKLGAELENKLAVVEANKAVEGPERVTRRVTRR